MSKKLRRIVPMFLIAATTLTAFGQEPIQEPKMKEMPAAIIEDTAQEIPQDEQEEEPEEEPKEEIEDNEKDEDESYVREMIISLDSDIALIDDVEYDISTKPFVMKGRAYLPIRFTGDKLLEANIDWNNITKEATVSNANRIVRVKMGSKTAYVNGDELEIEEKMMGVKSRTYLPLRVMANLFDIQIDYDEETRAVTMLNANSSGKPGKPSKPSKPGKPDKPVVKNEPTAEFEFDKDYYTAGQPVKAIDKSFHEEGKNITSTEWMVDHDERRKRSKLESMFSKPNAGTYDISLRVEAGKGNWSKWETKEITINPNMPPEITLLNTHKDEYAAGEELGFTYTHNNEPWENLKSERWTYRGVHEPLNKAVVEKPKYIFHPGEYIVSLRLEDDFGNWSETKETKVIINDEIKQNELEYRFTQGEIGDTIDNFQRFNYQTYPPIEGIEQGYEGGKLILSNSPEKVKEKGILYKDKAKGKGKLVFHHHNSFTDEENEEDNKRVVLTAKNTTDEEVVLNLTNKVLKGPSNDIMSVGQKLLYDYLKGVPKKVYTLEPGEQIYITDSGNKRWRNGELLASKMDYDIEGELEFTIAAVGSDTKIEEIEDMKILDKDEHPRGTFDHSDIFFDVEPQTDEPSKIILGAGMEEWMPGYDAITHRTTENRGNYGVNYSITITAKEDMGIILNPRAGTFRGAVRWDYDETYLTPNKGYIMGDNSKAINLGVVKAGETKVLEYTLPNGSASPVVLGFIPKDHWDQ